jgi:branched-chain amino acid transport system ATP-binding protein
MPLLEARSLTRTFGSVTAADDISISVEPQEVVGMIGANGAGKTTFVNMVTGYLKPSQGRILFEGSDITALTPRQITRRGICRSFQVPQVFMSVSLFENLLIAQGVAEETRVPFWRPLRRRSLVAQTEEIIARYDLGAYRDHLVGLLPQGVRKLLDIAMAMAHHPRVILLDEPTSGVSVQEKFGIMDVVMGALRETGVTVLFIEHDMEIIERYGSRVVAFAEGRVIADGPPQQVLADEQVRRYVIGEVLRHGGGAEGGAGHA